jgi:uncharacterized protein DUF6065
MYAGEGAPAPPQLARGFRERVWSAAADEHKENTVMDLICHLIDRHPVDIRPARKRRSWMDQTPDAYAYRCLPLSIANAHSWEIYCPVTFEAEWNGGAGKDDVQISFDSDSGNDVFGESRLKSMVAGHFGSGILTFDLGLMITTSPGYDLWVTGPVNDFKDGIQALSAVVETYWMPFTFTMNWKFTRPNCKVKFERDEPFCSFFPIEHGLIERFNPTFKEISQEPDLERQYKFGVGQRQGDGRETDARVGTRGNGALRWQPLKPS